MRYNSLTNRMKTTIIQLDPHDDVISARDKISWSKAARVLLVWPRKGSVLERRVDLLLLLRHARHLGAQLALVSHSGEVKNNARELGIPVFETSLEAQRTAWRRPQRAIRWRRLKRSRKPLDPQGLRKQREVVHATVPENRWTRIAAFAAGVLSLLALVVFFAPGARVELSPQRSAQQLDITLWAGPSIRAANPSGGLPAHPVTVVVEGRNQARSSGSASIPNQAASGEVLLTNLTDRAVNVPAGSVIRSAEDLPLRYVTTRAVQLPAGPGESRSVKVEAVLPGRQGNLPAGQVLAVEGPLGLSLTAENPAAISGGIDRTGPAPSQRDYRDLKESLLLRLQSNAVEEIAALAEPGQRLLEGTLVPRSIVEEHLEPPIGQPGDQLFLTLRVEFEAWMVEETDLQAVAQAALDANLPDDLRPVPGSLEVSFLEPAAREGEDVLALLSAPSKSEAPLPGSEPDAGESGAASAEAAASVGGLIAIDDTETARWPARVKRQVEADWSEQDAVRAVLGRPVDEAARILAAALPLAGEPRIEVYPSWWPRMPFLPFRLEMVRP